MLDGIFRRRRLPHWDVEDATYFVTTCLAGSIPAQGLLRLQAFRDELELRPQPVNLSAEEWEINKHKLVFAQFDNLIDSEPALTHLANPEAAAIVASSLLHFAGERYDVLALVVMPSHFHWVFHPRTELVEACVAERARKQENQGAMAEIRTSRQRIMQSVKGYSAYKCNRLLGLAGKFWQDESYDHVVRSDDELLRIIEYIENNPLKAGLVLRPEDWRWSSAWLRQRGLPLEASSCLEYSCSQ
jgi:type I restriction enzyme R subunit